MIEPKPYEMKNPIQNYGWGTKGKNAFITNLLDIEPEIDLPYAELWMGAHPKAASEILINNKYVPLDHVIRKCPIETLGDQVASKYNKSLPFLFKVLSANEPLSIQLHPNKEQAEQLHSIDPINYPDENHKPEIAIALDKLKALIGFKPVDQIRTVILSYKAFENLTEFDVIKAFLVGLPKVDVKEQVKNLYELFVDLFINNSTLFNKIIFEIISQIEKQNTKTEYEILFVRMYEKYGYDIGLISILFFNLIELKKGEAIFTPAGVPHAYIEGNIIECMANSDNVIRAGLTPKFQDVENLLKYINCTPQLPNLVVTEQNNNLTIYKTEAAEFEVIYTNLQNGEKFDFVNSVAKIMIITDGVLTIKYNSAIERFSKGNVVFLPAILKEFSIQAAKGCELFIASCKLD